MKKIHSRLFVELQLTTLVVCGVAERGCLHTRCRTVMPSPRRYIFPLLTLHKQAVDTV
jgi:hypothetical protein